MFDEKSTWKGNELQTNEAIIQEDDELMNQQTTGGNETKDDGNLYPCTPDSSPNSLSSQSAISSSSSTPPRKWRSLTEIYEQTEICQLVQIANRVRLKKLSNLCTQPKGYELKGEEMKVYKLRKALYGLKQAPRAWYERIGTHFNKNGSRKSTSEATLNVKTKGADEIMCTSSPRPLQLIVTLSLFDVEHLRFSPKIRHILLPSHRWIRTWKKKPSPSLLTSIVRITQSPLPPFVKGLASHILLVRFQENPWSQLEALKATTATLGSLEDKA
ncbi:hypothetical protein Sango_0722300 [Sesamum angolense]|uniref:Reverse transcriptase Ty1/copia-type domain-containing protein n=1 Tax=Sesamum angolense TaxID=2727404 RepID=A0AAE1X1C5_9LAMI|nr:hypothetical protein Sango_0722300 [Sesamum angolense]